MIDGKKILAIIPARGGSKGLPRKNILDLNGMPLIAWTINAARSSKYIDHVILSSDDQEICKIAKDRGCDVPFIRPAELAGDTANSASVVAHAIEQMGDEYSIIILLQPTSPFRNETHIDAAFELFSVGAAETLVSVGELSKSPEWMYFVDTSTGTMLPLVKSQHLPERRQDASKAYFLNGAIYIVDRKYFLEHKKFIDGKTLAYVMDVDSSLDIDSEDDLTWARIRS